MARPGSSSDRWQTVAKVSAVLVLLYSVYWYWSCSTKPSLSVEDLLKDVVDPEHLIEHGRNLSKPEIIKVLEGVYVAHGYTLANSILIEAPEGLIVVDTTERADAAKQIISDFRKISKLPLKAIVYTHNHVDHTMGAVSFLEENNETQVDIWGHETLERLAVDFVLVGPRVNKGAIHQFGSQLGSKLLTCGLGYSKDFDRGMPRLPNRLVHGKRLDTNVAGLNVTFLHVPGETDDQMAVWLPDRRVLLPGDNIYRTFPNLYAIRGVQPRNVLHWHHSLQIMRDLQADYLAPSHTRPLEGRQLIHSTFTVYMAGIQYVHDQTVRYLNRGLHPLDIASRIQLPPSLANHEYLWQYYGTVPWSVRAVYENYLGWFSGDPVELLPHTPQERALRLTALVGADKLLSEAEERLRSGSDLQWALELVSAVFTSQPDNIRAREIRFAILKKLAGLQNNPLARNFYLVAGLTDLGKINYKVDTAAVVNNLGMGHLLNLIKQRLKAEETEGVNITVIMCFTDSVEAFKLQIEYSVLLVDPLNACPSDDLAGLDYHSKLTTTTRVFKDIMLKKRKPIGAYLSGDLTVSGSLISLKQFFGYMDMSNQY